MQLSIRYVRSIGYSVSRCVTIFGEQRGGKVESNIKIKANVGAELHGKVYHFLYCIRKHILKVLQTLSMYV